MSNTSTHRVTIRGGELPVWVVAGDSPAVVFLHYWGGSHRTFDLVSARLAPERATVSYDYRGWGAARELPGPYRIEQLADDVLDMIGQLDIGRYVLAGHSMGAKVAQLVASRGPGEVTGLVLIGPAPPRPVVDAETADRLSHAYDSRERVEDALNVLTHHQLPTGLREQVLTDSLGAGNDDARLAWPRHGMTLDITAAASAIGIPVLILAGQYDEVEPPASLEANILPFIPGARMTVIEGTGHLSPLEAPGQVAILIDQFIATLPPVEG